MGFVLNLYADTAAQCNISGASDGATATVSIDAYDEETKTVTVGFYNDSEKVVTVMAKVTCSGGEEVTVVATVQPQSSTSKTAKCKGNHAPQRIAISSAKCK